MIEKGSCSHCLDDCNDVRFLLHMSDTIYWFQDSKVAWNILQSKTIYKRELIFGIIEALTSVGANFSLFVGMSCLTFFETLFFVYLWIKHVVQARNSIKK